MTVTSSTLSLSVISTTGPSWTLPQPAILHLVPAEINRVVVELVCVQNMSDLGVRFAIDLTRDTSGCLCLVFHYVYIEDRHIA